MINPALTLLHSERAKAQARVEDLQQQVRDAKAALRSYEEAIDAITEKLGSIAQSQPQSSGSLKDAVLAVIANNNGVYPLQIVNVLEAEGRQTTVNTVLSTISRLKSERRVFKKDKMWFAGFDIFEVDDEPGNEEASPDFSEEASQAVGPEAELVDLPVVQPPIANRENAGSSPARVTPIVRKLLVSTSLPVGPTNTNKPFTRRI